MIGWLRRLWGDGNAPLKDRGVASLALVPLTTDFWMRVEGDGLAQGDLLPDCFVPELPPDFGSPDCTQEIQIARADLIVITQSCDLENKKATHVALCWISSLSRFEQSNSEFAKKGRWEEVRQGRRQGLYLLPSPIHPHNNRDALVVTFRQIVSLPFAYLLRHSVAVGPRWRLQSPYLEHFFQGFGHFFMRVGLPSAIPPFK